MADSVTEGCIKSVRFGGGEWTRVERAIQLEEARRGRRVPASVLIREGAMALVDQINARDQERAA